MKKEASMIFILFAFLIINLSNASAFSPFEDLKRTTDMDLIVFIIVGAIFFLLINFALSKFFKGEGRKTAQAVSALLALLMTFYLSQEGFGSSLPDAVDNIFSSEIFEVLFPILALVALVLVVFKLKKDSLLVLGAALVLMDLLDLSPARGSLLVYGLGVLAAYYIYTLFFRKKDPLNNDAEKKVAALEKDLDESKKEINELKSKLNNSPQDQDLINKIRILEQKINQEENAKNDALNQVERQKLLRRNLHDLKQKYMAYLFAYNRKGGNKRNREQMLKAMNIIIEYARRVGVSKQEFLSKQVGGMNAKAPEQLKAPYDG